MGGQIAGTTQINYKTKNGILIQYIFYDLKGSNRYPQEPEDESVINKQLEQCLADIEACQEQLQMVRDFNPKYKYRFTIMHQRKIQQHLKNVMKKLSTGREHYSPHNLATHRENQINRKKQELELKISEIELATSSLKISLASLTKYITEKTASFEFVELAGPARLVKLLDKEVNNNKKSIKTNFGNQIDLLRFLKGFSTRYPRQYYKSLEDCKNYGNILMDTFHPVCTPVTAYSLSLLQDYIWRAENGKSIITILQQYSEKENYSSYLSVFCEILESSNNILMIYYVLKFINELVVTIVDEQERVILRQQIDAKKYSLVLQNIKYRLQSNFYKIEYATFIHVSQQIYKFASKGKRDYKQLMQNPEEEDQGIRQTIAILDLEQHIIANVMKTPKAQTYLEEQYNSEPQQQEFLTVYISESGQKQFNSFILNVLAQIRNYFKIETYAYESIASEKIKQNDEAYQQKMENKINDMKMEQYLKCIRMNCIKNNCTETMLGCLKNMQYYDRQQWRKLDSNILDELGVGFGRKEAIDRHMYETMKQNLKEKEDQTRRLLKEISQLKAIIKKMKAEKQKQDNNRKISSLPKVPSPESGQKSLQSSSTLPSSSQILPPPPPPSTTLLPPPPILDTLLLTSPEMTTSSSSSATLPPIPILGDLPLPPPLGGAVVPTKHKTKKQPKIALKTCNYAPLPYEKIAKSVWQQIDEEKVWLDYSQIESLFAKTVVSKVCDKDSLQKKVQQKSPKKEIVKLLSPERWRNIEIILAKLKIPKNGIRRALIECTGQYVEPSVLESVSKIFPRDDEQQTIRMFAGDESSLGKPELFIKQLITVPQYQHRIKSMIFASSKDEIYYDLEHKMESLTTGFNSLRQDYRLHHILQLTLALGNYLNGTSFKGGAWGFKVDSLSRLEDVKSSDTKMNAAFYVIKLAWRRFEYPIFQKQELEMYQDLSKISITQIRADIDELRANLASIQKAESSIATDHQIDNIGLFCQQIKMQLKIKLQLFTEQLERLQKAYQQCSEFYCQDTGKQSSDEIGKKLFNCILFLSNTEKTLKIVEQEKKKVNQKKALKNEMQISNQQNQMGNTTQMTSSKPTQSIVKTVPKIETQQVNKKSIASKATKQLSTQQKLEEFERTQDNVLKDMMKKREERLTSMIKYR